MSAVPDLDPTQEYRLERGAMRLLKTLFRPGDVVCLAWKVSTAAGQTRMHHRYRLFEQLVAQHSAGGGPFRQLLKLNAPRVPVGRDQRGEQLFDLRRGTMSTFVLIRFANSPTRQPGRLPCNAAAPTFRPFAPSAWIWTMAVLLVLRVSRRTLPMGFSRLRTSSFRRLRARSVRATVVVINRVIGCLTADR